MQGSSEAETAVILQLRILMQCSSRKKKKDSLNEGGQFNINLCSTSSQQTLAHSVPSYGREENLVGRLLINCGEGIVKSGSDRSCKSTVGSVTLSISVRPDKPISKKFRGCGEAIWDQRKAQSCPSLPIQDARKGSHQVWWI